MRMSPTLVGLVAVALASGAATASAQSTAATVVGSILDEQKGAFPAVCVSRLSSVPVVTL
jgi:hypothetical protein